MQEMEVDEDAFDYLPTVAKRNLIYHSRIYTSAKDFTDFVVTGGKDPVLYEIQGKQILSSFHLTNVFKGITLPTSVVTDNDLNILIKVYFSYKKKIKQPFFFLRAHNDLVILGKVDQQFTVYREFQNITEYDIGDLHGTGEPTVEIVYTYGTTESFQMASLCYLNKGIDLRSTNNCKPEFDKFTRNLQSKVTELSCEVHEMDIKLQKQINDYMAQCQTIDDK